MRVLIVEDNNEYRKLLRRVLAQEQDLELVAEATDGEECLRLAQQFKPDVILMDINMPGMSGLQATRRIKEDLAGTVVLILSGLDGEGYREQAADCGADAYLPKTTPTSEILAVIRGVRRTKAALDGR